MGERMRVRARINAKTDRPSIIDQAENVGGQ